MRILFVSEHPPTDGLVASLQQAGVALERPPAEPASRSDASELTEIATALREFEALLAGDGPDAVLLGSASNQALAALLVASKLGVPVARLGGAAGEAASSINGRVIEQLADATLADEAEAITAWARDT
jgi:UDP-N-acetylglucosamine 2-epimerase